jgi:hypothetical protein
MQHASGMGQGCRVLPSSSRSILASVAAPATQTVAQPPPPLLLLLLLLLCWHTLHCRLYYKSELSVRACLEDR